MEAAPATCIAARDLRWLRLVLDADREALSARHRRLLELLGGAVLEPRDDLRPLLQEWLRLDELPGTEQPGPRVCHASPGTEPRSLLAGCGETCDAAHPTAPIPVVRPELRQGPRTPPSPRGTIGSHSRASPRSTSRKKLEFSSEASQVNPASDTRGLFGQMENTVRSHWFDVLFSWLIFINVICLTLEAQKRGLQLGTALDFKDYSFQGAEWPGADRFFVLSELSFGILFTLEFTLKMLCLRRDFLQDGWNLLDACIVVSWQAEHLTSYSSMMNPMLLRLLRLARLLRLVRLVRAFSSLDSLIIMTTAMRGSIDILMWSIVVLTLVLVMCALFLQTMVIEYLQKPGAEPGRHEVFLHYGTFSRSLLSMFEITLGNWMPPCRALVENVSEWYLLFFIVHKFVIGFSVLAVINGVFIQETFKVANQDDHLMMLQRDRAIRNHTKKMHALFAHLDDDENDNVSLEEFRAVSTDPRVKVWLSAMELEIDDVDKVFDLLCEGRGVVSIQQLVKGVMRLKGTARNLDVTFLLQEVAGHRRAIRRMEQRLDQFDQPRAALLRPRQ